MQTIIWDIPLEKSAETFTIIPLGDIHLGARSCDEEALKRTVRRIREDESCYWIGMGDMTDGIGRNIGDKRADESALASWLHGEKRIFEKSREAITEVLTPIAGKCLGFLSGNHEESVLSHVGQDMYYHVAAELSRHAGHEKNLALGYSGFVRMRFRRPSSGKGAHSVPLTIYATHGYGGGRKSGGKALKLEDQVMKADADLYFFGHVHSDVSIRGERMAMTPAGKLVMKPFIATLTGTYLQTVDEFASSSYSERSGYSGTPIGSPEVTVLVRADGFNLKLTW